MSFFFDDVVLDTSRKRKPKELPLETVHKLGCTGCPLFKCGALNPDVPARGSEFPLVYFLGEAPGETEDNLKQPFVGKSGQLLEQHITDEWKPDVRFNNCVRTRTPQNRTPEPIEIEYCRPSVEKDIVNTKPKVIVALGATAFKWFGIEGSISIWRGKTIVRQLDEHCFWIVPTYHPSAVLRNQKTRNGKKVFNDYEKLFKDDLNLAFDLADSDETPIVVNKEDYHTGIKYTAGNFNDKEITKIERWLNKLKDKELIGIDIETNGLRPYKNDSKILTIAVGTFDETIAFPVEWEKCWNLKQSEQVKKLLHDFIVQSGTKIAHNLKFEQEWLASKLGTDLLFNTQWADTQAQAYALDERCRKGEATHSLDILIYRYFGFNLKALSNIDRTRVASYDPEQILKYNALDTKWTVALFDKQKKELDKTKELPDLYHHLIETCCSLSRMQLEGLPVNWEAHERWTNTLNEQLEKITAKINSIPEVEKYNSQHPDKFNPGSSTQLAQLLTHYFDVTPKKGDKISTDDSVLSQLDIPIAKYVLEYRAISVKLNTFVTPLPTYVGETDERVHTDFNLYFTTTGRLCVAKGTMVEVVRDYSKNPLGIKIEDVKPGDYVYTYNDDLNITLNKVVWSGKTGTKKCLRIHWTGTGKRTKGFLDLTANHPVRLANGSYKRADELRLGDSILSLTRSIKNGRSFFYQTGKKHIISDQRFVYEHFNGVIPDKNHIHHKDHNKLNNVPDNLEMMLQSDHAKHHAVEHWSNPKNVEKMLATRKKHIEQGLLVFKTGPDNSNWDHYTKYELLKMIAVSKGNVTKAGLEHKTFQKKCAYLNIDYNHCCRRYTKHGVYISKSKLLNMVKVLGTTKTCRNLKIDYTKLKTLLSDYGIVSDRFIKNAPSKFTLLRVLANLKGRLKNLRYVKQKGFSDSYKIKLYCKLLNIDLKEIKSRYTKDGIYTPSRNVNNHTVTYIEFIDEFVDVYDMEVENTHNFIANGLCVSNSASAPNTQNYPKRKGKEIRELIKAPDNHWMVLADYGQIEARLIAIASQDSTFCNALWNDYDVHMHWAKLIAEEHPPCVGGVDKLDDPTALKAFRDVVKNRMVFPAFFGSSAKSIIKDLKLPEDLGNDIFNQFWRDFNGIRKWQRWIVNFYERHGYVESLTGRRRHGPMTYNEIVNMPIQSTAADVCLKGMNRLIREGINVVLQVHDDLPSFVPDDKLDEQIPLIAEIMCDVPYPWVNVPMLVEITAGPNWYEQEDVGVFKSTEFKSIDKTLTKHGYYRKQMGWD